MRSWFRRRSPSDLVEAIQVLTVAKDDLILVKVPRHVTDPKLLEQCRDVLQDAMRRSGKHNTVLVIADGTDVSLVRSKEIESDEG